MTWINRDQVRIPLRDLKDISRDTLKKLAKAGLKLAEDELERRDEVIGKPPKHKLDWVSSAVEIDG